MADQRNPFLGGSGGAPRQSMKPAPKAWCFTISDPGSGGGFTDTPVPVGTRFIWNTLHIQTGLVRMVKGRFARYVAPLGMPEPALPANEDHSEFQACTVSMVWLDDFPGHPAAIRELFITGIISLNAFASLLKLLSYKQEIQRGQLPVLEIHKFHDVETSSYGTFGAPVCEVIGFVEYDEGMFGAPIIRPPPPMVSGGATPRISNDNNGGEANTPVLTSAVTPVEPPKPANDPLARFRPVGSGKTPY